MISKKYATQEEILLKAEASIGIPLKYIDKTGRLKTGKGAIGTVMRNPGSDIDRTTILSQIFLKLA